MKAWEIHLPFERLHAFGPVSVIIPIDDPQGNVIFRRNRSKYGRGSDKIATKGPATKARHTQVTFFQIQSAFKGTLYFTIFIGTMQSVTSNYIYIIKIM